MLLLLVQEAHVKIQVLAVLLHAAAAVMHGAGVWPRTTCLHGQHNTCCAVFFSGVGHCHTGVRGDWQVETAHALLKSVAHAWMNCAGAAESATQAMEAFLQQALPLVGAVELLARGDVRSVCHALLAMID